MGIFSWGWDVKRFEFIKYQLVIWVATNLENIKPHWVIDAPRWVYWVQGLCPSWVDLIWWLIIIHIWFTVAKSKWVLQKRPWSRQEHGWSPKWLGFTERSLRVCWVLQRDSPFYRPILIIMHSAASAGRWTLSVILHPAGHLHINALPIGSS